MPKILRIFGCTVASHELTIILHVLFVPLIFLLLGGAHLVDINVSHLVGHYRLSIPHLIVGRLVLRWVTQIALDVRDLPLGLDFIL